MKSASSRPPLWRMRDPLLQRPPAPPASRGVIDGLESVSVRNWELPVCPRIFQSGLALQGHGHLTGKIIADLRCPQLFPQNDG